MQGKRSLGRLEDEARRRQRALQRVLKEMTSTSARVSTEQTRRVASAESRIDDAKKKASHEKRTLTQSNGDHNRAIAQVAKDRLRYVYKSVRRKMV